jgi:hypothetical protein
MRDPILIRRSELLDRVALERLAALEGRTLPEGTFLLAEVHGELVAAAPIETDAEPLADPFRPTADICDLLAIQAARLRGRRAPARNPMRMLRDAA